MIFLHTLIDCCIIALFGQDGLYYTERSHSGKDGN